MVKIAALLALLAVPLAGCTQAPPLPAPTAGAPCPQWVVWPADAHGNAEPAVPGCNLAANLRAMVADPADLARGRPLGRADGLREGRVVESYQQGKTKPFQGAGALAPTVTMPGAGP
jgi:type IV pilus biogenesis protein CpaD/CtpE